jgi:NTE family protein
MARGNGKRQPMKRVSLALQGGGAHGAFTWGVLHELMQDGRIFIEGFSGTSAGAMNAVVFADGFLKGSREGAIAGLEDFWHRVSQKALMSPLRPPPWRAGGWNMDDYPAYFIFDTITRLYSPYQLNPLDLNPLRDILAEIIDFARLRKRKDLRVFVNASNVRTCMPKVFKTADLSVEVLLASACLPLLFKAVEVDGEHYWDGGYLANPAIYPLIHECDSNDIVIVQINPMNRPDVPTQARDILSRMNEMSFNASLVREMSGIATISHLIADGRLQGSGYELVRFHMIAAEEAIADLGASSKFNADWGFLRELHDRGVTAARRWLDGNFDRIGVESTLDVLGRYGSHAPLAPVPRGTAGNGKQKRV